LAKSRGGFPYIGSFDVLTSRAGFTPLIREEPKDRAAQQFDSYGELPLTRRTLEGYDVSVRRGKKTMRGRAGRGLAFRTFSRLAVLIATFALFGQLLALPYHHPQGSADQREAAQREAVVFLKATFGDAAVLCVTVDDDQSSTPEPRHHHGDGDCPLCQFGAQTVLFTAPAPALPERVEVAATPLAVLVEISLQVSKPRGIAQPRAPPFEA
jgi:hypothetical protein